MEESVHSSSGDRHVLVTEGGHSVEFVLPHSATDHIQKHISSTRTFYEVAMLRHARAHIQPGNLVVDVGAYIGNHTLFFAGVCGANVACFEPHPDSFTQLVRNVESSGLSNLVTAHQVGVGRIEGFASSNLVDAANGGSNQLLADTAGSVRVVRLDDQHFQQPPRVIKIDVEGMEIDVLLGAEQTIRSARPILYVECADLEMLERVVDLLAQWGFTPIGQFNATPTICFHSTDSTSVQRQLAHLTWTTDHSFSRVARRLSDLERQHAAQAAVLDRALELIEAQRTQLGDLTASLAAQTSTMARVEERLCRDGERLQEGMVGIQRTERDLHTMMLRTDAALTQLRRGVALPSVESRRPSAAKPERTKAEGAKSMRSEMFARARRKLRKLERDPDSFFEDSKSDFVRDSVGPFYLRELRKRRGK